MIIILHHQKEKSRSSYAAAAAAAFFCSFLLRFSSFLCNFQRNVSCLSPTRPEAASWAPDDADA